MAIKFYRTKDPHGYMGNFYRARMFIYGRWWNWVESPYQAEKSLDRAEQDLIWQAQKPMEARDLGQKVKIREGWDLVKDMVMYDCVMAKFLQHKNIRDQLIATGDEELIEDTTTSNDMYWGCGKDGTGQNHLGQILMRVRKELAG